MKNFVIFGAGELGGMLIPRVQKLGMKVVGVCDNSPEKQNLFQGIKCFSPEVAVEKFPNAIFLVGVFNSSSPVKQLIDLGCKKILTYPVFARQNIEEIYDQYIGSKQEIISSPTQEVFKRLADKKSKKLLCEQNLWRSTMDYEVLENPDPIDELYFPTDVYSLRENESFLDCGAFDGDSIQSFLGRTRGKFSNLWAVEPEEGNLKELAGNLSKIMVTDGEVKIFPCALGNENGYVQFDSKGPASKMGSDKWVSLSTIDDLNVKPSIIKIDVEGSELEVLNGGLKTIESCRPVIISCLYHHWSHLWEVPLRFSGILKDYFFFLRRYADECWETMCYMVPRERMVQ